MKRTLWRHFAILLLLLLLYSVAQRASTAHGRAPAVTWGVALWAALLETAGDLFRWLPLVPAIAVATSRLGRIGRRELLQALVLTLLGMALLDVAIVPATNRAIESTARREPAAWPTRGDTLLRRSPMDSVGVLRTAARLVVERSAAVHQLQRTYAQDHPRYVAASVISGVAQFTLPFILMGLVLGASSWLRRRVIFRSPEDEVVARWTIALVAAPAAMAVIGGWSDRGFYDVLFRGEALGLPLVPYAPFLVLGALGWRAALKVSGLPETSIEESTRSPTSSRSPVS